MSTGPRPRRPRTSSPFESGAGRDTSRGSGSRHADWRDLVDRAGGVPTPRPSEVRRNDATASSQERALASKVESAARDTLVRHAAERTIVSDWVIQVLREQPRDEVLALLRWLPAHREADCLGALVAVVYRFPGDAEIARASSDALARIQARLAASAD